MASEDKNLITAKQVEDVHSSSGVNKSRRTFAQSGLLASAILSFTSRSALGGNGKMGICSGFQSAHPSGHPKDYSSFPKGHRGKDWCDNAHDEGTTNPGNCNHWKAAGACPTAINLEKKEKCSVKRKWYCDRYGNITSGQNPSKTYGIASSAADGRKYNKKTIVHDDDLELTNVCYPVRNVHTGVTATVTNATPEKTSASQWSGVSYEWVNGQKKYYKTESFEETKLVAKTTTNATLCSDIFPGVGSATPCHEVLMDGKRSDDVTYEAVTLYLNCKLGVIDPSCLTYQDVQNLYACARGKIASYTPCNGVTVGPDQCKEFMRAICPA